MESEKKSKKVMYYSCSYSGVISTYLVLRTSSRVCLQYLAAVNLDRFCKLKYSQDNRATKHSRAGISSHWLFPCSHTHVLSPQTHDTCILNCRQRELAAYSTLRTSKHFQKIKNKSQHIMLCAQTNYLALGTSWPH